MPTTIRKALISGFGDVSNVNVITAEISDPVENEVQVKVLYSGFAGSDINMRLGRYPMQKKAPLTPGYCFVGIVRANGPGATKFHVGDLVTAVTVYDSEAQLINQPEKHVYQVPKGMDPQQACGLVMDWNTAYGMVVHCANVSAGQRVFVHGMSGAVGYAVMTISMYLGAKVYGTASERNHAAIRELGATPFVYTNHDWMGEMQKLGGADVIFDPLGFESWDRSFDTLSRDGLLVGYGGNLASFEGDVDRSVIGPTAKLLARGMVPFCPKRTKFYYIKRDAKTFVPDLQKLFELHTAGKIRVPVKSVWDLEHIQDAHRGWTSTPGMGSMLIKIPDLDEKTRN